MYIAKYLFTSVVECLWINLKLNHFFFIVIYFQFSHLKCINRAFVREAYDGLNCSTGILYQKKICNCFTLYFFVKLQVLVWVIYELTSCLNPFPHKDAFWRLCSRRLFENMVTKEEIAQNKQFLPLLPCFQLYSIIILSFKGSFQFFLLTICCMWKRVN